MQQLNKAEKIKQCISQLDEITTVEFRGQVEQLVKSLSNSIFNIVLHGVDELCKKVKKLESDIAIETTLNELLIYCKNCNQLSQKTNNTIHNFEILPTVLKERLLSSLKNELKISIFSAVDYINRVEQKVIYPAKLILEQFDNSFSFNSNYQQVYYNSKSLEKRWQLAVINNNSYEIEEIKKLFHHMFTEAGLTHDFTDEITSKKLNKVIKRLLKRSIAQLHTLATFHQLQSAKDQWIDADSLRSFKSDEIRKEKHQQKISDRYTGNPSINIFSRDHKDKCLFAEEMAFAHGIDKIAQDEGAIYKGFLTCTLPTRFHHISAGRQNTKYKFKTVTDGHKALQKAWANTRAGLTYHQQPIKHFIKVFHPHLSSIPHMHAVLFLNSRYHVRLLVTQMASRLNQHDNWIIYWSDDEIETSTGISSHPDQSKNGIVFKIFDDQDDIAHAVRYCLKGLKNGIFSTDIVDNEKPDAEEPIKIQAWCSTHSIRRYSSSAVGKTLWRDLRKLPDFGSEAQKAAKEGDYAKFYQITQRDKNEILLPMQKKNGDGRIWIFAKKITTDSPLVFVNYIQPRTPKVPGEIVENETHTVVEVVDLPCHNTDLTVIYNKRDRMISLNNTHTKNPLLSFFKVGKSFLRFFKSGFQVLRRLLTLRL